VADGITINTLVAKVSFSGYNVPDGTPVTVSVQLMNGLTTQIIEPQTLYTHTSVNVLIDPDNSYSYVYLNVPPINSSTFFDNIITFTSTYDKSGKVSRNISDCVEIQYLNSSSVNDTNPNSNTAITNKINTILYVYNIVNNTWMQMPYAMNDPRASVTVQLVNG
jgi:hypothetical protein